MGIESHPFARKLIVPGLLAGALTAVNTVTDGALTRPFSTSTLEGVQATDGQAHPGDRYWRELQDKINSGDQFGLGRIEIDVQKQNSPLRVRFEPDIINRSGQNEDKGNIAAYLYPGRRWIIDYVAMVPGAVIDDENLWYMVNAKALGLDYNGYVFISASKETERSVRLLRYKGVGRISGNKDKGLYIVQGSTRVPLGSIVVEKSQSYASAVGLRTPREGFTPVHRVIPNRRPPRRY